MSAKKQYNLLYILYCLVGCFGTGFTAVFLQYRGISNTLIGIAAGVASVASIFLAPYISTLIVRISSMTVNRMMVILYCTMSVLFLAAAFMPVHSSVILVTFITFLCLHTCVSSMINVLASGYVQDGQEVNFGLARGLGSVSWAITAALVGPLVEYFDAWVLAVGFAAFSLVMIAFLRYIPQTKGIKRGEKNGSVFHIAKTYKVFFLIILGFAFCGAGNSAIGTYMPNILRELGGNTSVFGYSLFINAMVEMPFMAITARLMRKVKPAYLCAVAGIGYILRNGIIASADSVLMVFTGLLFQGPSFGILTALTANYVIFYLEGRDQIMGQTMVGMCTAFGAVLGNILGGWLTDTFGLSTLLGFAVGCTACGAVILLLSAITGRKKNAV